MKIGYACEGWLDKAFISGLKDRWCAHAALYEGHFRGTSIRRGTVPGLCAEFALQGCEVVLLLTDATPPDNWSSLKSELEKAARNQSYIANNQVLAAVTDCGIEVWYSADGEYFAQFFQSAALGGPGSSCTGVVKAAFGTVADPEGRRQLARDIVRRAPIRAWIRKSNSFAAFYDDVRALGNRLGCHVPNEREREV